MRNSWMYRFVVLVLFSALILGSAVAQDGPGGRLDLPGGDGLDTPETDLTSVSALMAQAQARGSVSLIVGLDVVSAAGLSSAAAFDALPDNLRTASVINATNTFLSTMSTQNVTVIRRYRFIPYVAVVADANGLNAILSSPFVNHVAENAQNEPLMNTSVDRINVRPVWNLGYTGAGQTVVVIDTGTNRQHPALKDRIVSEACFGTNQNFSDATVRSFCPGGATRSFATGSGTNCPNNIFGCDHGTHVAGTVASSDSTYRGVAPSANLINMQVFSRINALRPGVCRPVPNGFLANTCISASNSDILAALERVYALRNRFNIASVNMSLGGGRYTSVATCDNQNRAFRDIAALLRGANIAVIAASGNDGYANAMSSPACVSTIISVGALKTTNEPAEFSNLAPFIDLYAPGTNITSTVPGGGFGTKQGTSMAAPHVAGVWALMRQMAGDMRVNQILNYLKNTGGNVTEVDGNTYKRVLMTSAASELPLTLNAPANQATLNNGPVVFTWRHFSNATAYRLIIKGPDERMMNVPLSNCTGATCTLSVNLKGAGNYRWFVRATLPTGVRRSLQRRFTGNTPNAPTLVSPANNATVAAVTQVVWQPTPNTNFYRVTIINQANGVVMYNHRFTDACGSTCTHALPAELQSRFRNGRTYRWSVRAINTFGPKRSENFRFTISP